MAILEPFGYVDSSVLIASTSEELHSAWALSALEAGPMLSSTITRVELARYARRTGYPQDRLRELESKVTFLAVDEQAISGAIAVSGLVKALDALHVGTWARLHVAGFDLPFITADRKQASAAAAAGATVIHPYGDELGA